MLKKIDTAEKMQICEEYLICKECPCFVYDKCRHPYIFTEPNIGDIVIPSVFNTDSRIMYGKQYTILDSQDGLVKVNVEINETDWFCSEDFLLLQE